MFICLIYNPNPFINFKRDYRNPIQNTHTPHQTHPNCKTKGENRRLTIQTPFKMYCTESYYDVLRFGYTYILTVFLIGLVLF